MQSLAPFTEMKTENFFVAVESLSCVGLLQLRGLSPTTLLSAHRIFQARIVVWVAIFFSGFFPTQELNLRLLLRRLILYH